MKKIIIIGMISLLLLLAACKSSEPGKYDALAKCLTEKGVVEYGAFWCPNCAKVKRNFGKSFQYINYVECDPRGKNANPELCLDKGIDKYATFEFPDGSRLIGTPTMEELAEKAGCALPE